MPAKTLRNDRRSCALSGIRGDLSFKIFFLCAVVFLSLYCCHRQGRDSFSVRMLFGLRFFVLSCASDRSLLAHTSPHPSVPPEPNITTYTMPVIRDHPLLLTYYDCFEHYHFPWPTVTPQWHLQFAKYVPPPPPPLPYPKLNPLPATSPNPGTLKTSPKPTPPAKKPAGSKRFATSSASSTATRNGRRSLPRTWKMRSCSSVACVLRG